MITVQNQQAVQVFREALSSVRRHVALIGSSGSGKSAIWGRLRNDKLAERHAEFPRRYVTRTPRADDDSRENVSVESVEFMRMFEDGKIAFYWEKGALNGVVQNYGFPFCAGHTVVYGCNNAFVLNSDSLVSHINPKDVWLRIYISCSEQEILRRLRLRGGKSRSHVARLPDSHSRDVALATEYCDVIVSNERDEIQASTKAIREFILR